MYFLLSQASSAATKPTAAPSSASNSQTSTPATEAVTSSSSSEYSAEYCLRLKALNEQVAKWISEHVAKDPVVLLTPIFKGNK